MNHAETLKVLSGFIGTLLTPYDINLALDDLVVRLQDILHIEGAGVSLAKEGSLQLATALPPEIMPLEKTQLANQSGPCVTAFREQCAVTIAELDEPENSKQWPEYCRVAKQIGFHAVAAIPMVVNENSIGAISLYSQQPHEWSDDEIFVTRTFADAASVYLMNASSLDRERVLNKHLQHALESRIIIEQAKGIIAEARQISVEESFELIRRQARSRSASLRSVADAIVSLGLRI